MESKGTITSDGYEVEVAIPFKSLRYEAGKGKLWGIHVWRNIDRMNDEIDSWVPMSRDASGTLNQAGHITGLEDISTERTIELIPSLTVSETGRRVRTMSGARAAALGVPDPGKFVNEPVKADPGLTAKFVMSSAATIDLAINPDFAQVEADATVNTANQRFPIFFQEKRPFFLEGIDIFRTIMSVVHTRTIVDPDIAVKLTGKRGRNTYGLLFASDNCDLNQPTGKFHRQSDGRLQPMLNPRLHEQSVDDHLNRLKPNRSRQVQHPTGYAHYEDGSFSSARRPGGPAAGRGNCRSNRKR